ncbi:hypothetical protein K8T06_00950 [bacterium]|nr:hypothetical protein [bacterium]
MNLLHQNNNGNIENSEVVHDDPLDQLVAIFRKYLVKSRKCYVIGSALFILLWIILLASDLTTRLQTINISVLNLIMCLFLSGVIPFSVLMMILKKIRPLGMLIFLLSVPVFLFSFSELAVSHFIWDNWHEATVEKGDQIASALENFETTNQSYPADLRELLPMYLLEIPKTQFKTGPQDFHYQHHGKTYNLWFWTSSRVICKHVDRNKWQLIRRTQPKK